MIVSVEENVKFEQLENIRREMRNVEFKALNISEMTNKTPNLVFCNDNAKLKLLSKNISKNNCIIVTKNKDESFLLRLIGILKPIDIIYFYCSKENLYIKLYACLNKLKEIK